MPMAIRRIAASDQSAFARIAHGVFDEPVRPDRLAHYLTLPGHLMVLAFEGELVVGQCAGVLHCHPDKANELYVDELGTADAYLRRGIANAMLAELFAWGRELGCEDAWLGTERDNSAAIAFYRQAGGREDDIKYYEFAL